MLCAQADALEHALVALRCRWAPSPLPEECPCPSRFAGGELQVCTVVCAKPPGINLSALVM